MFYSTPSYAFDAAAPVREQAHIKVLQVCSLADNGKEVMVIEDAENLKLAKDFIEVLEKESKDRRFKCSDQAVQSTLSKCC